MLSERERRIVWIGGAFVIFLLYLWLVLFPLIGYHHKMSLRIDRSWNTVQRIEGGLEKYVLEARPISSMIRRAAVAGQKSSARGQLEALVSQVLGKKVHLPSLSFEPVWEGKGVKLTRCLLRERASPYQVITLIQRIDYHYLPMRVVRWHLRQSGENTGDLEMEIYLMEAVKNQ